MSPSGVVGEHGQDAGGRQVKAHGHRFLFQQVESVGHFGVFGVGDVENSAGHEGVPRLAPGVAGVHVRRDGKGFLVQLGRHNVLVDARSKDEPQPALVSRHFKVRLGGAEQVRQVVVEGALYRQSVQTPGLEVKSDKA